MNQKPWYEEFPGSVIVCDRQGIILEMNREATLSYAHEDGDNLIGKNLLDCHPEPARSKVTEMLSTGKSNIYTIERDGCHKLIYQVPWRIEGQYQGLWNSHWKSKRICRTSSAVNP